MSVIRAVGRGGGDARGADARNSASPREEEAAGEGGIDGEQQE
jgi:hypothetical protein